jgi:hypothetical protein
LRQQALRAGYRSASVRDNTFGRQIADLRPAQIGAHNRNTEACQQEHAIKSNHTAQPPSVDPLFFTGCFTKLVGGQSVRTMTCILAFAEHEILPLIACSASVGRAERIPSQIAINNHFESPPRKLSVLLQSFEIYRSPRGRDVKFVTSAQTKM